MSKYPKSSHELSIYYDELCPVCTKEIDHYRKLDSQGKLRFVDIAAPQFNAAQEGLNPDDIHERFHVKTLEGEVLEGVPAFQKIWQTLGIFKPLDWAVDFPLTRPFFEVGYKLFTKVRPYLRRKGACDTGYCETKSL